MKKLFTIAAIWALAVSSSFALKLWTDDLIVTSSVGGVSEYVFRGIRMNHATLVTSVGGAYKLYNGTLYVDAVNYNGLYTPAGNPSAPTYGFTYGETDLVAGYKFAVPGVEKLTADVGLTYYWFTTDSAWDIIDRSTEIYAGLTYEGLYVNPSVYLYYDINKEQMVGEVAGNYSWDLTKYGLPHFTVDSRVYAGVLSANDTMAGQGNTKPSDGYAYYGANADFVYHFHKTVEASVGVGYAGNNNGSDSVVFRNSLGDVLNHENSLFWGGKITASF